MPSLLFPPMVSKSEAKAVVKKLFVVLNVLLAFIFAYQLFALYREMGYKKRGTQGCLRYESVRIDRSLPGGAMHYRNIFGSKKTKEKASKSSPALKGEGKNELVSGNVILRVRGIFIWDTGRYAIISVTGNRQKQDKEWKKVSVGDQISGFTIHSIRPDIVMLKSPSSGIVCLRIFKHS